MKKIAIHIGIQLSVTVILYAIIYLIKSFVLWAFANPFQWIIDLPTYSSDARSLILLFYIIYALGVYSIIAMVIDAMKPNAKA